MNRLSCNELTEKKYIFKLIINKSLIHFNEIKIQSQTHIYDLSYSSKLTFSTLGILPKYPYAASNKAV